MNKIFIWGCFLFLLFLVCQPGYGQIFRKKKTEKLKNNDLSTPKKRYKSRTKYETQNKVKVKKSRNYIEKKTNDNQYKVKVSPRSGNVPVIVDNSKSKTVKNDKTKRGIKKEKKKSEQVAASKGKKQYKKRDRQALDKEEVTQTVKTKSQKKRKKSEENQAGKVADSDGPVKIKPEPYRKEPGTIYKDDKKGGSKYKSQGEPGSYTYKTKSQKRKKKDTEKKEDKIADSDGPVGVKPEPYRRKPGSIYKDDPKGGSKYKSQGESGAYTYKTKSQKRKKKEMERKEDRLAASDGPIGIKPEPYRKRPGTIYREDKKGGSKYKSQGEKASYTCKSMTPDKKERLAKRSKEQGFYDGDMKLAKRTKEMHPSSKYLEAKKSKSVEEKEKSRKKELRKSRGKNSGQPKVVTEKKKKPKYDTRENKIWNE